ncbi:conserved hypothetical protein [Altererythrobacter sp. B11]|uniref:hypothetical protein n=1 Tax=Altererythrobacter sp. B11 TaxID=2060312 RepID=UPI000DC73A90|nr:hypothetical protein [Altererythrobacter sp. B11]BBC72720.1 conserved hypothetical protein [Altererythrobacter sp. B11]
MAELAILFPRGQRPAATDVAALLAGVGEASISLDPARAPGGGRVAGRDWLELLMGGITFDLAGLAPGSAEGLPKAAHVFALPPGTPERDLEAISLRPGPHLSIGGGILPLPVLRCLAALGARLSLLSGAEAVAWAPARSWSGPAHFRDSVNGWLAGGVFPGFGLAALSPQPGGAMVSEGLAAFTGQELRISPALARDRVVGAKLGLRLLHWMVENGTLRAPRLLTGPEGETLRLDLSRGGSVVEVWKA